MVKCGENCTLVDCVKCFLQVEFKDCDGLPPFKVYFNRALDGVKRLCCLSVPSVSTLGFRYLCVNCVGALCEKPPRV